MGLQAVDFFPKCGLRTGTLLQVDLLCLMLPCSAPFTQTGKPGRTAVAIYLDGMAEDSDSRLSSGTSFFTIMLLKELVLLKEPEPLLELKLDWKFRWLLRPDL